MNPRRLARRVFARLARDRRGIAAVEFALVAPAMLLLCFGSVEVSQAVSIDRMVSLTAGTVGNLVSQYTTISASTQMPDILNASTQILYPNPSSNAKIVVSLVNVSSSGKATVTWSQTLNGAARATGSTITLPSQLVVDNTNVILSEVTYAYTPVLDFLKIGAINLSSSTYMYPRASTTINLSS